MAREAASLIGRIKRYRSGQILTPLIDDYFREASKHNEVRFSKQTMEILMKLHLRPDRDRGGSFSASALSTCMRAQMLGYLEMEGTIVPNEKRQAIFLNGDWLHLKWQGILLEMGVVKWKETEPLVEQRVSIPEWKVEGTLDVIGELEAEDWIIDVKGVGPGNWQKMKDGFIPQGYLWQQHAYMRGTGISNTLLLVESKATQEYVEIHVPPLDSTEALQVEARVKALNHYRENRQLPPVLHQYPSNPLCRECPFLLECPTARFRDGQEIPI
jgi:hypothetical protein